MRLETISGAAIIKHLKTAGTSEKKIKRFLDYTEASTLDLREYYVAHDAKYTVIKCGDSIGIASRNRYHKTKDKENVSRGIAIAVFRLINNDGE